MIEEGTKAPAFTLTDKDGVAHSLKDFSGKKVILYFYPKDDTPGCTVEATGFRDNHAKILDSNAVVIGVSPDSESSHKAFVAKFDLPFILLSDPEKKVLTLYDAWGERNLYGRKFMGVKRSTVLIGEDGVILKHWKNVRAKGHVEKVLELL